MMNYNALLKAHRMLLSSSCEHFTRKMFEYMNKTPYIVGHHHKLIWSALDRVVRGECTRLIINISPRYGKCVSPETRIMTTSGLVPASEVSAGDMLYTFDNGKLSVERCNGTEPARKPSVRVTMRSGRSIECSYDHPMLTTFGYEEAQKLKPGDRIRALYSNVETEYEIPDDELVFTSLMIFEGNCGRVARFTNGDDNIVTIFRDTCKRLGIEIVHYACNRPYDYNLKGGHTSQVPDLLKKYGIYEKRATEKRLPKDWFALSRRQKLFFLDLMFATDGYAQGNGTCGVTLANHGLVLDIQHILSSVGILSSIYYKHNNGSGAWVLNIPRRETIKLLGMISFFHKRPMAERALLKSPVCISDTFPYEIIRREHLTYKTLFPPYRCTQSKEITREKYLSLAEVFPQLRKYIDEDFYYDRVESVEPIGEIDLVHIEVANTHNFIANGLVSHNTEICSKHFIAYGFSLNPQANFLHLSYSGSLVTENSMAVRDIMSSEYYQALFPARYRDGNRSKWRLEQGGQLYATSTLGQITGFGAGRVDKEQQSADDEYNRTLDEYFDQKFNPGRFNGAIVIDDPLKPGDALSDTVRESVNLRFETTIRNRVNSRNTPIIIIMQRLHEHDLCGYLQEVEPDKWTVLSIPVIQYDNNGDETALWPFKHTLTELYELRDVNPFVFETQYMQNPKPLEGLMYREFKTYDVIPFQANAKVCCYMDTADVGSDYFCGIFYVEHSDANYVIDVLYTKKPMEYTEPVASEMLCKHKVDTCVIESNNGGRGFKRNVEKLCREMGNGHTYFRELTQTHNKAVRIFTQSNEVCNLTVFPRDWEKRWPEFSRAIINYRKEGKNAHDDAPDALTGTIEMRRKNSIISDEQLLSLLP